MKSRNSWLVTATLVSAGVLVLRARARRRRSDRVKHVMIDDVVTIDASASLVEAAQAMKEANVGVLPVVSSGRLRGLITDRDIVVRAIALGADAASTTVGECSTRDLICARPDTAIDEAMEVMAECQVGRLPVVDDANHLVGMVTLSSLALRSSEGDEALHTAQEVSKRSAKAA